MINLRRELESKKKEVKLAWKRLKRAKQRLKNNKWFYNVGINNSLDLIEVIKVEIEELEFQLECN